MPAFIPAEKSHWICTWCKSQGKPCADKSATRNKKRNERIHKSEVNAISCPHFEIKIRQRSKGQSAVAGAAYQSGERLYSEFDHRTKNYFYKAGEVIAKGILLPERAPPEYENRQTLWNAVEKSEKQWNAQLSRGIIMPIPRELPKTEYKI